MARYDVTIQEAPTEDNTTGLRSVVVYADRDDEVLQYIAETFGDVVVTDWYEVLPA